MNELQPRRTPKQERSRERVEAIVAATKRLVGERGNDAVSVREIASEAGVPIGSVYQYFPDKNAILRTLITGFLETIETELGRVLGPVETVDDLAHAVDDVVDTVVKLFKKEPAMGTIWSSVAANTVLRELDWSDARRMAQFLSVFFRKVLPDADPDRIFDACLYAAHTTPMTVRTANLAPKKDGQRLIRELKTLLKIRMRSLVRG